MPASIAAVSADAPSTPAAERLVSLDAYRGLTMFAMSSDAIGLGAVAARFPSSPWWQAIGYQVDHVPWVGCAAWDLIQPSFVFIVGVAMVFSCATRRGAGKAGAGWRCTPPGALRR